MRLLFTLLLLLLSTTAFAEEEKVELPPLDPSYNAVHPMALVNRGSSIFAINLPSYRSPHDLQVVYEVKNSNVAFLSFVKKNSKQSL